MYNDGDINASTCIWLVIYMQVYMHKVGFIHGSTCIRLALMPNNLFAMRCILHA